MDPDRTVTAVKRPLLVLALAGLLAGIAISESGAGSKARETKAVIELFTSQGCSSCPPADKLLGEYAERKDVLALSFSVDYWDYLGWKDTLASPDNSERQRAYSAARGDRQVYTPQVVVNGRAHVVGSDRRAIEAAMAKTGGGLSVPISMQPGADSTTVTIGAAPDSSVSKGTIWLVMYDQTVAVPIERGENSGKTVSYYNVVRKLRPIAMWKGEPMSIDLPKSELTKAKVERCAVLLQTETADGLPGPVLGAANIYYKR
jgi:hypothetical protein